MIIRGLTVGIFQEGIDFDDIRIVVAVFFPGAVTTNDQVLRHESVSSF